MSEKFLLLYKRKSDILTERTKTNRPKNLENEKT